VSADGTAGLADPASADGQSGEMGTGPDNEETGLLTATDGLVDAINTAAFMLQQ
jgi:hypothetical protein